jgi:hypothetical protein
MMRGWIGMWKGDLVLLGGGRGGGWYTEAFCFWGLGESPRFEIYMDFEIEELFDSCIDVHTIAR